MERIVSEKHGALKTCLIGVYHVTLGLLLNVTLSVVLLNRLLIRGL